MTMVGPQVRTLIHMEGNHVSDQEIDLRASRAAGWYYAEGDPPGTQRYWDGGAWQGGPQVAPGGSPALSGEAPPVLASVRPEITSGDDYKGFFPTLFDLSLTSFLAPKVVRVLYIIAVAVICVLTLVLGVLAVVNGGGAAGIVGGLVVIPLGGFLYLLLLRIQAEFVMVSFRTNEQLRSLRNELDTQN